MESEGSTLELLQRISALNVRLAGSGTAQSELCAELHRIEEAIRENDDRLTRAEFLAQAGNWSADLVTNRLVWSKGVFRIFGESNDFEPTFERWLAAVVPDDVARIREWCAKCLADRRAYPIEFQIMRSDGDLRTLLARIEREPRSFLLPY